jgi:hypothetical protein
MHLAFKGLVIFHSVKIHMFFAILVLLTIVLPVEIMVTLIV